MRNPVFALSGQNIRISLRCVSVLFLFSLTSHAQEVNVKGRIVDYTNTGMPGATVRMVKANLTVTTDSDGFFDFTKETTSIQPENSNSRKLPLSSALQFVADGKTSFAASLFSLQGKQIARIDNHTPAAGTVSLNPLFSNVGNGIFIATVQIGDQKESVKVSRMDNAATILNDRTPQHQTTADWARNSEMVAAQDQADWSIKDTLRITKDGYYEQYAYVRRYPEYINALIHHHKNQVRSTTATAPALAEIYDECGFEGKKVIFEETGEYSAADLKSLGIEGRHLQSLKIAPGYRVRLWTDNGQWFVKPEDDECFVDDMRIQDENRHIVSVDVEKIPDSILHRPRPRVFIAFHGLNELAVEEHDDKWRFVQENLDGIWYNAAQFPNDQRVHMWRLLRTRVMKSELPNGIPNREMTYPDKFNITPRPFKEGAYHYRQNLEAENLRPDMTNYFRTVQDSAYPDPTDWRRWHNTALGFQPGPFNLDSNGVAAIENSPFAKTFHESDGVFMESAYAHGFGGTNFDLFVNAVNLTHQDRPGKSFVWFMAKSGKVDTPENQAMWFQTLKNRYYKYESLGIFTPNDVIALVFYRPSGVQNMPPVPMIDPKTGKSACTITGVTHWMLNQ